ncbi:jg14368 [Pararge aegeria aegeria]|uniref:Jg14368 protein n=1 Tax=Pararge aegeria aegeria TaxID=348720 RepID=A0A8S4SG54_9NEOP|nr:jg14368 [Pararge aegeria aegeria]
MPRFELPFAEALSTKLSRLNWRTQDLECAILTRSCWNGSPVLVSAALVDPQRGGQTTLSASQVAVGSKRLRIVELGTPYKRPMSSSGRLSVDVMMMMMRPEAGYANAALPVVKPQDLPHI